jgi:hypothetical protein
MIRKLLMAGVLLTLVAAGMSAATPATKPAPSENKVTWDSYRLIVTRNIFSRDRRAPTRERTPTYTPSAPRPQPTGPNLVLTGVVVQETQCIAFFEDSASGDTTGAVAGQALAKGRVRSVCLDGVEYESGGVCRKIAIGQSLDGQSVSFDRTPTASAPAGTATTSSTSEPSTSSQPSGSGDKGTNDVLERMRQRRQQELNK